MATTRGPGHGGWLRGPDGRPDPVAAVGGLVCGGIAAVYPLPGVPPEVAREVGDHHAGALDVASEMGADTTVRVLLPAAKARAPAAERVDSAALKWPPGELGTVLVVEDEELVRRVARAMLEKLGFEVVEANDGRRGVTAFDEHRERIVAVLLDLTMPVLDGAQALAELQRKAPRLPVFIMSGYDDDSARQRCSGLSPSGFLRKPFRLEDLRRQLWTVFRPEGQ